MMIFLRLRKVVCMSKRKYAVMFSALDHIKIMFCNLFFLSQMLTHLYFNIINRITNYSYRNKFQKRSLTLMFIRISSQFITWLKQYAGQNPLVNITFDIFREWSRLYILLILHFMAVLDNRKSFYRCLNQRKIKQTLSILIVFFTFLTSLSGSFICNSWLTRFKSLCTLATAYHSIIAHINDKSLCRCL